LQKRNANFIALQGICLPVMTRCGD